MKKTTRIIALVLAGLFLLTICVTIAAWMLH